MGGGDTLPGGGVEGGDDSLDEERLVVPASVTSLLALSLELVCLAPRAFRAIFCSLRRFSRSALSSCCSIRNRRAS